MQRYALTFLISVLASIALFSGFNALIDPFGISGAPDIPGLTSRDTRLLEDGGRVHIADQLARGQVTSIILGSSRTVDGFAHDPVDWPGGIVNAGMRGTNMFELGKAMALAGHSPQLRCVVIGIDLDELGTHSKAKATYWLSALTDGNRAISSARVALSPSTFAASVQLIADNLSGSSPRVPWADSYDAGAQRQRYERGVRGIYRYYLGYNFDRDRLAYFERALDTLTGQGVQVTGFIHPLHAWREEALFRSGRADEYFALRSELTDVFDRYAQRAPANGCGNTTSAALLWDFSGFQSFATMPAPSDTQTTAHQTFYEPSHYLSHIGQAMLDRMRGGSGTGLFENTQFGVQLTPANVLSSAQSVQNRRQVWLESPDGQAATALLDDVIASDPTAERSPPQYLNRDDWRGLEDALGRVASVDTRRLQTEARPR
jgi:hypothetical protein